MEKEIITVTAKKIGNGYLTEAPYGVGEVEHCKSLSEVIARLYEHWENKRGLNPTEPLNDYEDDLMLRTIGDNSGRVNYEIELSITPIVEEELFGNQWMLQLKGK